MKRVGPEPVAAPDEAAHADEEHVVLVDSNDRELGVADKVTAHRRGLMHRAVSVLVRDRAGRLLLQKRHAGKYHSGGLWTNCCCGHPRPQEPARDAAIRRLEEEMGFACELIPVGSTIYRAEVGDGLVEHELVHLFAGTYEGRVAPDPREADGYAWVEPERLAADMAARPERYSAWFRHYAAAGWLIAPADKPRG